MYLAANERTDNSYWDIMLQGSLGSHNRAQTAFLKTKIYLWMIINPNVDFKCSLYVDFVFDGLLGSENSENPVS